jgi:polar amino acid transport system substrate-binding protein
VPARAVDAPDLEAAAILLPGLIDSADTGAFVELVAAMGRAHVGGSLTIRAYPEARVIANVTSGQADFAFPDVRLGAEVEAGLPYRYSTEAIGRVSFVLYSHVGSRLNQRKVLERAAQGQPYAIAAPNGDWGFPTQAVFDFSSALRMIDAGRLDGFLWAQEEADLVLREVALKTIHRQHFKDFDDVFMVPRTPRGDFVDGVLTRIIRRMRADGSLAKLYARVHGPYDDWQPATANKVA